MAHSVSAITGSHARRLALACVLATAWFPACGSEERRPDVVVVLIDTLRSDRLSCYGYPRPTSPTIDRIAGEGALFEDCTSQAPWTLPSMASMLSGKYYTAHREYPEPREFLLAQAFKRAGYRTVGVVANALMNKELGYHLGFDHYDATPGDAQHPEGRTFDQLADALWAPLEESLWRDSSGERPPLFLYLHPVDPHFPYYAHPELDPVLPVDGAERVQPEGWQEAFIASSGPPAPANDPGWRKDLAELQRLRGLYDQEVRHVDDVLARVLARLKELGVLEHAVVAILSDHGEGLWEHAERLRPEQLAKARANGFFFAGHGHHLYEEAVRTPFILWGAGVPKGFRSAALVENLDLYPTLCELARIEPADGLHGKSLVPLMRGDTSPLRERSYSFLFDRDCVRDASGLKLIAPTGTGAANGVPIELFDVRADVHERENLAATRASDASRMCSSLSQIVERHPTRTTLGKKRSDAVQESINAMGYTTTVDPTETPNPTVPCERH